MRIGGLRPTRPVALRWGCFHGIVLAELQQDYQVDLRIADLTLNPAIPKSNFHPLPAARFDVFKYGWRYKVWSACIESLPV